MQVLMLDVVAAPGRHSEALPYMPPYVSRTAPRERENPSIKKGPPYVPRTKPPTFVMNMAKPPRERWRGALQLFRDPPKETWVPIFHWHNRSLFDRIPEAYFPMFAKAVRTFFPDQAAELEGISEEFASVGLPVSFEYLAAWAYSHESGHVREDSWTRYHKCKIPELEKAGTSEEEDDDGDDDDKSGKASNSIWGCTALIAQDTSDRVHHVALMDQVPTEIRKVVLHIKFKRGDQILFEGADWYWFTTGVTRAVRKGCACD
jgi:hypothetical protein